MSPSLKFSLTGEYATDVLRLIGVQDGRILAITPLESDGEKVWYSVRSGSICVLSTAEAPSGRGYPIVREGGEKNGLTFIQAALWDDITIFTQALSKELTQIKSRGGQLGWPVKDVVDSGTESLIDALTAGS